VDRRKQRVHPIRLEAELQMHPEVLLLLLFKNDPICQSAQTKSEVGEIQIICKKDIFFDQKTY
jgi:hypothetical protein